MSSPTPQPSTARACRLCRARLHAALPLTRCTTRRSRVFTSIVAGVVSGILGFTNTLGLLAYIAAMALVRARALASSHVALLQPTREARDASWLRRVPRCFGNLQTSMGVFLKLGGDIKSHFVSWCVWSRRVRCKRLRSARGVQRVQTSANCSHRSCSAAHCDGRKSFCFDGVLDAAMTYLLFWTCVRYVPRAAAGDSARRACQP